jgi:hypothetical protein
MSQQKGYALYETPQAQRCLPHQDQLTGIVADQPALHGLLAKVRDLGLPLLLVECVAAEERCPDEP